MARLHCTQAHCRLIPRSLPLFTLTNAVPGQTTATRLVVTSSRDDICALAVSIRPEEVRGALPLSSLFVSIADELGNRYVGGFDGQRAQASLSAELLTQRRAVIGYAPAFQERSFIWHVTIDPHLGNEQQGTSASLSLYLDVTCANSMEVLPQPPSAPTPSPTASAPPTPHFGDRLNPDEPPHARPEQDQRRIIRPNSELLLGVNNAQESSWLSFSEPSGAGVSGEVLGTTDIKQTTATASNSSEFFPPSFVSTPRVLSHIVALSPWIFIVFLLRMRLGRRK